MAAMESAVSLEDLRGILDRVQEWTRAVDQKVAALMAAAAVSGALIAPALPEWFTVNTLDAFRFWIGLSVVLWFISIGASTSALFTRTTNPHKRTSVTFFGDIAGQTLDTYRKKVNEMSDADLRSDYIEQVHVCAKICSTKHFCVKLAAATFIGSIVLIVLCYSLRGFI